MRLIWLAGLVLLSSTFAGAEADAGWPLLRHHHQRYAPSYAGRGSAGESVTGGFTSARGEAYVVRPTTESVRYYAVADDFYGTGDGFQSAREAAREAAREEFSRIEAERAQRREAAREAYTEGFEAARAEANGPRAEAARESVLESALVRLLEVAANRLLDRMLDDPAATDPCQESTAQRQPSVTAGSDGRDSVRPEASDRVPIEGTTSAEAIRARAEELASDRAAEMERLQKQLKILESLEVSVPQEG